MTHAEEARVARTESLFRDVNERIAESATRFGSHDASFVCECSDPECTERVDAPLRDYQDVRGAGSTFLLAPGHEEPEVERVVARQRRFNIVDKVRPRVRELVERTNPRTRTVVGQ